MEAPELQLTSLGISSAQRDLGESSPFSSLRNLSSLHLGNPQFSTIRQGNFEGIEFLDKLWIDGGNLSQYEPGSLKLIKKINHMIINVRSINIFSAIVMDILHSVTWLEVRKIAFSIPAEMQLFRVMSSSFAKKISFKQTLLTDATVPEIVSILEDMPQLVEVEMIDCRLLGTGRWQTHIKANQSHTLRVLTIEKLSIEEFYLFTDLHAVQGLLSLLTKVTVENTKVFLVPCRLSQQLLSLEYLDLSANLLGDQSLEHSACQGGWPSLQTLNLSQNSLSDLEMTVKSLSHLRNLILLDISQNNFGDIPDVCEWPQTLKHLNLSSTQIPKLTTCIPPTLEVLDVSANNLKEFGLQLPFLKELYLAKNQLKALPGAAPVPNLVAMSIRRNKLNGFSREEFESFRKMELLDASDNNSEWCKYELDFSHFRLFDENNDAAILVLLEPIQSKAIPKRFCKLRKIMNTKTYLEWPLEEEQQEMFWFNLKIALKS
ncbi:PREDICTED: toll-like receptor 2 type-2 [Haliaeetus leucocephalus]|uniref:toll-like receptor 2 type-2 n=1 Tax=Haliaeetus leucocephalus TaxID=52644 RepID=UPI00053CAF0B|nr:PREDICTED: toll-like receptor 2 type-2 [Haliaeetus leucocephalus]